MNLRLSVSGEALQNLGEQWRSLTSTEILDGIGSTKKFFLSNFPDDIEYGTTGMAVPL